ncbi:hypothetical protein A0H81_12280 [Grifola frondosa]|uniref:Cytochrome P450 n=1 Tax=Grifola frondosa TaxID=5627 RepID=A0A1C7LSU0_GRIFR|nr:hypothetical protein A0H81_12280 [Grifola frondosa]
MNLILFRRRSPPCVRPEGHAQYYREGPGNYDHPTWVLKSNNVHFGPGNFLLQVFGPSYDTKLHVLTFVLSGNHHRRQRKMLNPVFSAAHLRHMVPVFYGITHKVAPGCHGKQDTFRFRRDRRSELDGTYCTGTDWTIRPRIFLRPLIADVPNVHGEAVKSFVPAIHKFVILQRLFPNITSYGTPGFRRAAIDVIPFQPLQRLKHIVDTMHAKSIEIFTAKKTALAKGDEALALQVGEGKDIMSILLKANMSASTEDRLPEDELIAQMSSLIFAAMDTTSNALSRILHILAQHPDVQDRLRKEILDARDGKDLEYDDLVDLPYMDAVCRETLRLFPPASLTFREAKKDTVLPLSEPVHGRDGSLICEIPISKGTSILVGVMGSNTSKALWARMPASGNLTAGSLLCRALSKRHAFPAYTPIFRQLFRPVLVRSPLDNVPGPPSPSWLAGNLGQLSRRHEGWTFLRELSENYGPVMKLNGLFGERFLYVFDPLALHNVVIKDYETYEHTTWEVEGNDVLFGPGILASTGERHRKQRKMLNPVFSAKHMRDMVPIFHEVSRKVRNGAEEIDMLGWMGRTVLELIGQSGLGYPFDPLTEDVPNEFGEAVKSFMSDHLTMLSSDFDVNYTNLLSRPVSSDFVVHRMLLLNIALYGPPSFRRKIVEMIPITILNSQKGP